MDDLVLVCSICGDIVRTLSDAYDHDMHMNTPDDYTPFYVGRESEEV